MAKQNGEGESRTTKKAAAAEGGEAAETNAAVLEEPAARVRKKEKKRRPVRCIQQYTELEFRREFAEVCTALIKKAKKGSTAETRLLLQIGKFGDPKVAKRRGAKNLSEMLLDELKRRQDEREAAMDDAKLNAVSTGTNEEGAASGEDAEKG